MTKQFTVVGIGELLWDFLPNGKALGGAPANVAYHADVLGDRGMVLSRVGSDALGDEALKQLRSVDVDVSHVQRDDAAPTGTVSVSLDEHGHPTFVITENVAWDCMIFTEEWLAVASSADAVCFGTLAQRSPASYAAISAFVRATRPDCLVVFDVNLRQHFYTSDVIRASLQHADVCKLNEDELPLVASALEIPVTTLAETARAIMQAFDLSYMAMTRGGNGSVLLSKSEMIEHPGLTVQVRDTVGAGDAFTAGLIHALLRNMSLADASRIAAERGAWVASSDGAMPDATTFRREAYAA